MAKVYVFLADGFEDVEALIPIDVLRRGGVDVITVSTTEFPLVESAHGVNIEADIQFEQGDYSDADLLMLPGGMPGASKNSSLFADMTSKNMRPPQNSVSSIFLSLMILTRPARLSVLSLREQALLLIRPLMDLTDLKKRKKPPWTRKP